MPGAGGQPAPGWRSGARALAEQDLLGFLVVGEIGALLLADLHRARDRRAGGHPVETSMLAEGGWRLVDHAQAPQTLAKLRASPWQYVVLQEQSQIPAIALTAYAGEEDLIHALEVGFQQHLSKPIEPNELVNAIAQLVGRGKGEG